jgi:hypothetical protein
MSSADKQTTLFAKMNRRRISVLNSIRAAYPEMRDEASLMERVDLVQQDTFRILFDTAGYKNPSELLGLDYVNWYVQIHAVYLSREPWRSRNRGLAPERFQIRPDEDTND